MPLHARVLDVGDTHDADVLSKTELKKDAASAYYL